MLHEALPAVPPDNAPTEPLLTVGTAVAVTTAFIALFVSFGVHVSEDRQAAILGVLAVAVPLITAAWGRMKVFAPATVARLVAEAHTQPPTP